MISSEEHLVRSCIACRVRAPKRTLLRFVGSEGLITWDRTHSQGGRGVYFHPVLACWSKMTDAKRWERALRLRANSLSSETLQALMLEVKTELGFDKINDDASHKSERNFIRKVPGGRVRL